jgi:hypothetical protein
MGVAAEGRRRGRTATDVVEVQGQCGCPAPVRCGKTTAAYGREEKEEREIMLTCGPHLTQRDDMASTSTKPP